MKIIAYFFLILIDSRVEAQYEDGVDGPYEPAKAHCTYTNNGIVGYCTSPFTAPEHSIKKVKLELADDEKLYKVKKLSLLAPHSDQYWIIDKPFMFTRISNLVDLTIEGDIKIKGDYKKIADELLRFVAMDRINFTYVRSPLFDNYHLTFPQHLKHLIIYHSEITLMNWAKPAVVDKVTMVGYAPSVYAPAYPTFKEFDVSETTFTYRNISLPEIAFFCNMTKLSLNVIHLEKPCNCTLLRAWQKYLDNGSVSLTITVLRTGQLVSEEISFDKYVCKDPQNCLSSSDDPLKEAKNARIQCLHIQFPEFTEQDHHDETERKSWVFWLLIAIGFLVATIVVMLMVFLAESLLARSKALKASNASKASGNVADVDTDDDEYEQELEEET